jgi:RHH-type proline utilization regulon transcriptional repressor/proline dehydrogenase/delta 1-pyrroline-5-carboxylate dehydrogenase
MSYIKLAERDGKSLLEAKKLPANFISPRIFEGLDSDHKVVQEEIFGPVLVLLKARNIDHALELANNSDYGLTGGIYSRSPKNIAKAKQEFQVGNLYINRPCTGAVVARQAFGGTKQSSIGFKAGGPNYLLQFVQEKTITENTMRRGFVAD